MEKTFTMVKPDGVKRGLIGEITGRFERKGFTLVGAKLMHISDELAKEHYAEHVARPFFNDLVAFITSGPVFAMVWQGKDAIAGSRQIIGATNPIEATPGSIRGDFGNVLSNNLVHGSDSPESAVREIGLFFGNEEQVN